MKEKPESLVACPDCRTKFGRWRMRCPSCGTSNAQRQSLSDAVSSFYAKDNPTSARVVPKQRGHKIECECIFCHRGKADAICQTCHEAIHSRCIHLHSQLCGDFVAEVEKETERVTRVAPSESRSVLENTGGLADAINRSLRGGQ